MRHESHQVIEDTLAGLPLRHRLAHLAASVLVEDGALSVEFIIEVGLIMAKHLPENQRAAAVWHLNECAAELGVKWN